MGSTPHGVEMTMGNDGSTLKPQRPVTFVGGGGGIYKPTSKHDFSLPNHHLQTHKCRSEIPNSIGNCRTLSQRSWQLHSKNTTR